MLNLQWDERREILVPGNKEETISFAAEHFIQLAQEAIKEQGKFTVALSGGSTPKAIYQKLYEKYRSKIDWSKVYLFWSDERCVPPTDPESNYHMAMTAGLEKLAIPKHHIFRMETEGDLAKKPEEYERIIERHVGPDLFDLVMLGVGEDGHTASLFPETDALKVQGKAVAANFVPQKHSWRLPLTFDCINNSSHTVLYVLGKSKREIVQRILRPPHKGPILPAELVGTNQQKALWILDLEASEGVV